MAVVPSDTWVARATARDYVILMVMWFAELGKEAWPAE